MTSAKKGYTIVDGAVGKVQIRAYGSKQRSERNSAMSTSTLTEQLAELNEKEIFLKDFLRENPEYQTAVIGSADSRDSDYERLIRLMKNKWGKEFPDRSFFLEGSSYYLAENFFVPQEENVRIIKNLRYMPFILHSHQFIEVNYVVCSSGSAMISEEKTIPLEDGDIILSPPGFVHCFHAHADNSIIIDFILRITTFDTVFFNLLNNNNYLSALFSNALYGVSKGCILWHCREDRRLRELVISAYEENTSSEKYREKMLELLVMEFFLTLMRNHEQEAVFSIPYINNSDEQFRALLNYMHTHYQNVTLPKLAMQYNYSERQVIRLLKKHSEKNFSQLLTDIRMNKAIQLLKNSSLSISDIASLLGYSSKSYFVKVFRNTFTFDPEDFRKHLEKRG